VCCQTLTEGEIPSHPVLDEYLAPPALPDPYPSLIPHPLIPAAFEIGVVVVAVAIVVATRGRLGYDRYLSDIVARASASGVQPRPVPTAT
jgi:hypothetical protein